MTEILNSEVRRLILQKLAFNPNQTFSELWNRSIESNKFAYHLKKLCNEGLVAKVGEKYTLTQKGKDFITYIDTSKVIKAKQPLIVVFGLIKNKDRILIHKRLKEPFYGYHGLIGGKVKFGQTIFDTFIEEAKTEAGIIPKNPKLVCQASMRTYEKKSKELLHHHLAFVVESEEYDGEVVEKTKEGENHWYMLDEIKKLKMFPDLLTFIEAALSKKFKFIELVRYQDGMDMKNVVLWEYL